MAIKDCSPGGRLSGSLVGPWGASSAPAILDLHTANAQEICYQIQTIVESLGKKQGSHAFLVLSKSIFHNALIHEFISEILVCKLLGAVHILRKGSRGGRWTSLDASFARCFAIF